MTAQDISYALELASGISSDFGSEPKVVVSIVADDYGWEPVKEDGHTLLVVGTITIMGIVACLAVAFLRRH